MVQFSGGGEFANEFAFPGKKIWFTLNVSQGKKKGQRNLESESREEERAKKILVSQR